MALIRALLLLLLTLAGAVAQMSIGNPFYVGGVLKPASGGGGGSPVTIDNVGAAVSATAAGSLNTATVTTSANANRAIFVFIGIGDSVASDVPVVSVTTDRTSGTIEQVGTINAFNWSACRVYCIRNPQASVTHTISVDLASGGATADTLFVRAVSFYNVDQTTPFDGVTTSDMGGANTTAPSVNVTVSANGMGVAFVTSDSENNLTSTSGTALFTQTTVNSDTASAANYRTTTGALSHSSASQPAAIVGFNIRAQ